jgi:hypothetical protein
LFFSLHSNRWWGLWGRRVEARGERLREDAVLGKRCSWRGNEASPCVVLCDIVARGEATRRDFAACRVVRHCCHICHVWLGTRAPVFIVRV